MNERQVSEVAAAAALPLSPAEREQLAACETVIGRGLRSFVEVGEALARVREGRLYRAAHASFEEYCRDRWGLTRRHGDRLILAAEVVEEMRPMGLTLPANERQARALLPLDSTERQDAWRAAVDSAPNGKVTVEHVSTIVQKVVYSRRPPIQGPGHSDQFETPPEAVRPLLPYLPPGAVIWECAWGKGRLAETLQAAGHPVIGAAGHDFLTGSPPKSWDLICTNPPYSRKNEFLARAYELDRPFAFLLPLTALEGQERQRLYDAHGIELLVLRRRPDFTTPSGKVGGSHFNCAWFTWKLGLPRQLTFCVADEEDQ